MCVLVLRRRSVHLERRRIIKNRGLCGDGVVGPITAMEKAPHASVIVNWNAKLRNSANSVFAD